MSDFEIQRLEIESFGKFKQMSFDFKSGLNVIYGQNESGKTTVLNFIIYILYGADKHKNIFENGTSEKFIPRAGDYIAGSMEYVYNLKHYRIQRFDKGSVHKLDITDMDNMTSLNYDKTPGAEIFGFNAAGFVRTYFINAATSVISDDKDGNVADRLSKVTSYGDDDATYTLIKKNLCSRINTYVSKRYSHPIIPTLEVELSEAKIRLKKLEDEKQQALFNARELPRLKEQLEKCNNVIQKHSERSEYENKIKLNEAYLSLKEKYENAEREINSDRINIFKEMSDEQLKLMKTDGDDVLSDIIDKSSRYKFIFSFSRVLSVIFGTLTAVFTGVFAAGADIKTLTVFCAFIFVLFMITALISDRMYNKTCKKHNDILHKISTVLGNADIDDAAEFNKLYDKWCQNGRPDYDECLKKYYEIKGKYEDLLNTIKKRYELSDIIHLDKDAFLYDNYIYSSCDDITEVYRQVDDLKNRIFELEKIVNSDNDAMIDNVRREIDSLSDELKNAKDEKKVYETALMMLEKANDEISTVFAPKLSVTASDIFMTLTDGMYDTLSINNKLEINVKDGMRFIRSDYYSLAAKEQMYFALRLGIIKTITNKTLPIFIDDCFAFYDNIRLKSVYEKLADISFDRQIIYTTCRLNDLKAIESSYKNKSINYIMLSD